MREKSALKFLLNVREVDLISSSGGEPKNFAT